MLTVNARVAQLQIEAGDTDPKYPFAKGFLTVTCSLVLQISSPNRRLSLCN